MKRFAIAAAVVACGGKSPPGPAPVAPATPGDAAEAVVVPDAGAGCDAPETVAARLGGVDGTVELRTCTTREEVAHPQAGLTMKYREAMLVFHRPRGDVVAHVGSWTQGWEWGMSLDLVGAITGPRGEAVVFVSSRSAGPGDAAMTLRAYALVKDELVEVWSVKASSLDVVLEGNAVRISGCEASSNQADTCDDGPIGAGTSMSPQKAIARRTLTFDGTAIIER